MKNALIVNLKKYHEQLAKCRKCAHESIDCRGPTPIEPHCPKDMAYYEGGYSQLMNDKMEAYQRDICRKCIWYLNRCSGPWFAASEHPDNSIDENGKAVCPHGVEYTRNHLVPDD